jgi:CRP-like cAMP-binding protein
MSGSEDTVKTFFSKFPLAHADHSELLLLPTDHVRHAIYIESGTIDQYAITDTGNRTVLNTYKPGSFLPMLYILEDRENEYYFEVSSKSLEYRLAPAEKVVWFLHDNPDVTLDLLKRVYRGLDGLLKRMAGQMGGSADERLATELRIYGTRFGKKDEFGNITFHVTEQQLADLTGLARETVSRTLPSVIRSNEDISKSGKTYTLTNNELKK